MLGGETSVQTPPLSRGERGGGKASDWLEILMVSGAVFDLKLRLGVVQSKPVRRSIGMERIELFEQRNLACPLQRPFRSGCECLCRKIPNWLKVHAVTGSICRLELRLQVIKLEPVRGGMRAVRIE